MAGLLYSIAEMEGRRSITVFAENKVLIASDDRADFDRLVELARAGDESVLAMFDPAKKITDKFVRLTERVAVRGGRILFDNDEIDESVANAILRAVEEGTEDWAPLALFLEKLYSNPNEHSREQLYRWLATHKFSLAADGDVLGYKAVNHGRKSSHAGYAIVDGVEINGNVPNEDGSVIEMPRSKVTFDPANGCSYGLHVGTFDYAKKFIAGGVYLLVKFNPRDVVSVPTDSNDAKVRVCRYVVMHEVDGPITDSIAWDYDNDGNVEALLESVPVENLQA